MKLKQENNGLVKGLSNDTAAILNCHVLGKILRFLQPFFRVAINLRRGKFKKEFSPTPFKDLPPWVSHNNLFRTVEIEMAAI